MLRENIKGRNLMLIFMFVLYIICSASGLVLIKAGGSNLSLGLQSGIFKLNLDIKTLIGMLLYICSFLIFTAIIPKFNLTYIYPLAAGVLYVIIILVGVMFLKEKLSAYQVIGLVFILLGIVTININK